MAKSNPRNGVKNSQRIRLFSLALIVATAVTYLTAWNDKPIWDDNAHITQPELRSWHGLVEVWTQVGATQQYYPLVHSVFWIEQKLWGDSVLGYHLINIFLHGFAAIVLLRILLRLKVPGAWLARSEEHTSELQSQFHLVCRLLLEKKKKNTENKGMHVLELEALISHALQAIHSQRITTTPLLARVN